MSYKIWKNTLDEKGIRVCLSKDDGSYDFEKGELIDFLRDNLYHLPQKVREENGYLSVEKDGVLVSDEDIDYYLSMYNVTAEEIEKERVKRLKGLKLEGIALQDAIKNKTFWISENVGMPWNINYFLSGYTYEKEVKRAIKRVSKYGGVPYFAVVDHLRDGGIWVSVLFISLQKEEWRYEVPNGNGELFAGVYDSAYDGLDFGNIRIQCGVGGSVKRTA